MVKCFVDIIFVNFNDRPTKHSEKRVSIYTLQSRQKYEFFFEQPLFGVGSIFDLERRVKHVSFKKIYVINV